MVDVGKKSTGMWLQGFNVGKRLSLENTAKQSSKVMSGTFFHANQK